jgi:niacin transporter
MNYSKKEFGRVFMYRKNKVLVITIAALLSAIGILIPLFAPKIVLEPASFTLASHVPVYIAMFISPYVAVSVAVISSIGFFLSGFPIVVVLRAFSHIVFVIIGAFILQKNGNLLSSLKNTAAFGFFVSLIHAVCEVGVVTFFYWGREMPNAYYEKGYLFTVIGLVGLGTVIHSMIDYSIALAVWNSFRSIVNIPSSVKKVHILKLK